MSNRDYASKQLNKIQNRIVSAARAANRNVDSIRLVGAAKQQSAELVSAFHQAGLNDIGENYLNQGLEKQQVLGELQLNWHFIGAIQSNKTSDIALHFDWVHSVDRMKIAERLNRQSPSNKRLQVLLQIDIDDEATKAGVAVDQVPALSNEVAQLPALDLRGFMLLPRAREGFDQQRKPFARARKLLETCNQRYGLQMDSLSMGMSNDLEAAIAEGSTMVRIGTDLFGPRAK
ncbi:MAG: YggS family pyridoxal phosphate-dependent enzyme [Pseudomonadota bacterium]